MSFGAHGDFGPQQTPGIDSQSKEMIWGALQITVEERYDPEGILSEDLQQIQALISQVGKKVDELATAGTKDSKNTSGAGESEKRIKILEDRLLQEQTENSAILRQLTALKEGFRQKSEQLDNNFTALLSDIEAGDELMQMSPVLTCYKLKSVIQNMGLR